jgi:CheY-like chemotaxis protein
MVYGKALVVEDNADLRKFFCAALNLERIATVEFGSSEEALAYLVGCDRQELPNVALVDFSLGEKSGAELISKIRADSKIRDMKIVLISGWQEIAPLAKEAGADGFLRKPFDFEELCRLLNGWGLGAHRAKLV